MYFPSPLDLVAARTRAIFASRPLCSRARPRSSFTEPARHGRRPTPPPQLPSTQPGNRTSSATFPPSQDKTTLPHLQLPGIYPTNNTHLRSTFTLRRQNHPRKTGKTPQFRAQFPSREGATAPGGSKRPQKATRLVKTWEYRQEKQGNIYPSGRG